MNSGDQQKTATAKRCDGEQLHQLRGWVFEKVHIIPFEGVEGLKQLIIPVVNPQQVVCYICSFNVFILRLFSLLIRG